MTFDLRRNANNRWRSLRGRRTLWLVSAPLILALASPASARIWSTDDGSSATATLVPELSSVNATGTPPYEVTLFVPDEGTGALRNEPTAVVFQNKPAGSATSGTAAKDLRQEVRTTSGATGAILGVAYAAGNPAAPVGEQFPHSYYAAFAKAGTRFGPAGPGGIYVRTATGKTRVLATIGNVVHSPATADGAGDGSTTAFASGDAASYRPENGGLHAVAEATLAAAGHTSLGGIALDPSERMLYVVNLAQRSVLEIDTWAATPQPKALPPLPALASPTTCANSPQDLQLGGIRVTAGRVLVGTTCTAETSGQDGNVSADVWAFDLTEGRWLAKAVFHTAFGSTTTTGQMARHWTKPTAEAVSPAQLLLLHLDVTESGQLLVGFRNRGADSTRATSASDQGLVARAAPTDGGWVDPFLERPAASADLSPTGLLGAVAATPGSLWGQPGEELAASSHAVQATLFGVVWLDRSSVEPALQERSGDANSGGLPGSMGAMSLMAGWRSVTTTVYLDANGDGRQQPSENALDGVRVTVTRSGREGGGTVVTSGELNAKHGQIRLYLPPFDAYQLHIDPTTFAASGAVPGGRVSGAVGELLGSTRDDRSISPSIGLTSKPAVLDATVSRAGSSSPTTAAAVDSMPVAGRQSRRLALVGGVLLVLGWVFIRLTRLPMKRGAVLHHSGADRKDRVT